jgi:multiple sugar transport system substrate-binding protein
MTDTTMDRRTLLRTGAASAALLATGCGVGSGTASSRDYIVYGTPGGVAEDAAFKPVFTAYNGTRPSLSAHYLAVGGNYGIQYVQKLQTLIAGKRAPDIFYLDQSYLAAYADQGVIEPIDHYVAAAGIDLNDFWAPSIEALTYRGKLWGLPRDGAPLALWYNVDLFDKAGVDHPTQNWTWADYVAAGQRLTKRDRNGRAIHLGADRGDWLCWLWQNGGDVFDKAHSRCLLDQPAATEALQFMQDLVTRHHIAPSPRELGTASTDLAGAVIGQMFQGGQLAMLVGNRGILGGLCPVKFHFAAAPLPVGRHRAVRASAGPTVLWSGSHHKQQAFDLMRYICNAPSQKLKISKGFAFPSRKTLVQQKWYEDFRCGMSADTSISTAFTTEYEHGWGRPAPTDPRWPEIQDAITKGLDILYAGTKSAAAVGRDITHAVNALLNS